MDRPFKWTKRKTLLLLLITVNQVLSDNTRAEAVPSSARTVCSKESLQTSANTASPTPQLLNSLLTIAAANGVLPDILPKIQPLGITSPDTLAAKERPRSVTVPLTQQPTQLYQQESVLASTQPMVSASYNGNAHTTVPTKVPVQPLVISPGLKQVNQQRNPLVPQISKSVHTQPVMYALTHPKEEPKTLSTLSEQPKANTPEEIGERLNPNPASTNSLSSTESAQSFPVNLQITIPPPNVEAPQIIFINSPFPTVPVESSSSKVVHQFPDSNWYPYGYAAPGPQEIIVRKKKSWLKNLLPFILFSLFNNDKDCNNDGCCCCCPCNSRRRNTPVPYPIPIPTNNPIINTGYSNLSRRQGHKSDDDDDDDWLV